MTEDQPVEPKPIKKRGLSGVIVSFESVKDRTLGEVFGTDPIPVTHINKKMWALIRENNLRKE